MKTLYEQLLMYESFKVREGIDYKSLEGKIISIKKRIRDKNYEDITKRYYWEDDGYKVCTEVETYDIQECCELMMLTIDSPYDCTGREFTRWIRYARRPDGKYTVCHSVGLDV